MSYTIRVRGDSSAPITVEYLCPVHGRWTETLPRDRVPDAIKCTKWSPDAGTCRELAPLVISSTATKLQYGAVQTGQSDERPPGALDTRPIADGIPVEKWRKMTHAKIYKERFAKIRKEIL